MKHTPGKKKLVKTIQKQKKMPKHAQKQDFIVDLGWSGVFLQLFLVIGALLAITQCSPLSPSQNMADVDGNRRGNGANIASSANAGQNAQLMSVRESLVGQIGQNRVSSATIISITNAIENIPTSSALKARLSLLPNERTALAEGRAVDISLAERLRNVVFAAADIPTTLRNLSQNRSRTEIFLKIYVTNAQSAHISADRTTNATIYFAVQEQDGLIRIYPPNDPQEQQNFAEALRQAWAVHVDIHGNY